MANTGIYLEVDVSEVMEEAERLRNVMRPEKFDRVMYGIFRRTSKHVKQTLKKEIPKKYHIKSREVASAVGSAKISINTGLGVGCSIPISGKRRSVGGTFKAFGGAKGWESLRRKKGYKIRSRIVKEGLSVLPKTMDSYGGKPPFRNLSSKKLGKATFTREGEDRLPIRKVEGIAIPQMPMNRSQPEVQKDIAEYMQKRIEHEFQRAIGGK